MNLYIQMFVLSVKKDLVILVKLGQEGISFEAIYCIFIFVSQCNGNDMTYIVPE